MLMTAQHSPFFSANSTSHMIQLRQPLPPAEGHLTPFPTFSFSSYWSPALANSFNFALFLSLKETGGSRLAGRGPYEI